MTTTQEPSAVTAADNGIVDGVSGAMDNVSGAIDKANEAIATGRRVAAEKVPVMAENAKVVTANAKQAIGEAEARVERLSDVGIAAAAGFALGVTTVLVLTGAPRIVLALSAIPVAVTLRSATNRGIRPSALTGSNGLAESAELV